MGFLNKSKVNFRLEIYRVFTQLYFINFSRTVAVEAAGRITAYSVERESQRVNERITHTNHTRITYESHTNHERATINCNKMVETVLNIDGGYVAPKSPFKVWHAFLFLSIVLLLVKFATHRPTRDDVKRQQDAYLNKIVRELAKHHGDPTFDPFLKTGDGDVYVKDAKDLDFMHLNGNVTENKK